MSTEFFNRLQQGFEEELAEIIQDDCLDIVCDEKVTAKDFAHYVVYLSKVLSVSPIVEDEYKGMKIKVRNVYKGSVSVSSDDCTGVSRTAYYPFPYRNDEDDLFAAWLTLAQMINEAWYQCNN